MVIELFVLAAVVAGLVAVVAEIAVKDPEIFGEIATDVRRLAQPDAPLQRANPAGVPEYRKAA
jgi:hypothetical protein